jgi:hypothetical protein
LAIDNQSYLVAVGGSTNSVDFPLANPWQSTPGGGLDGFLTFVNLQGAIPLSTYLGGSADDQVLALNLAPSGTDVYLGGVTASTDWQTPGSWSGVRSGPTDGFLLHLAGSANWSQLQPAQGIYFGGSGADSVNALVSQPNGNVAAAGTTSSSDLPFANAFQSTYGGGVSNAFVAIFSGDLQTLDAGTYLGGSGTDQAAAIATNSFNEVLVGGSTSSQNFPVAGNPLSPCGNGSTQGLIAHLDSGLQPIYSTCFGGSGSYRIAGVSSDGGQNDYIGGYADSFARGGFNGFYATVTVPAIHAIGVTVGKDLAGALTATLGDPSNYIGTPVTATSSNPSQVLIGLQPDDPGQATATLASAADSAFLTRRFLVYCLTASATVPVTLSAPGYPTRSVNITCVPSGLYVNPAGARVNANGNGGITILPAAINPTTLQPVAFQNPRGGLSPIDIEVVNSNPALTFSVTSVTIDQYSNLPPPLATFQFQISGASSATVTFTTSSTFLFTPSNSLQITTAAAAMPALTLSIAPTARDLFSLASLCCVTPPASGTIPITFTSSDPSKVLLSLDQLSGAQSPLTIDYNTHLEAFPSAYLSVFDDSGPVSITASAPGYQSVTAPVPFAPLQLGFANSYGNAITEISVIEGQSTSVSVVPIIGQPPVSMVATDQYYLRPGASQIQFQLSSTPPGVVADSTANTVASVTSIYSASFQSSTVTLQGQSAGSAVDSIKVLSGSARAGAPLDVTVLPSGLSLSSTPVGYGLTAPLTASILGKAQGTTANIVLTVSDPTKALLAPDAVTPGASSIQVSMPYTSVNVYVQALAGYGSVEVTASSPGYANATVSVQLVPAAFLWETSPLNLPNEFNYTPVVVAYPLQPGSLARMNSQVPRPGLTGSVTLQIADASVATLSPTSIPMSAFANGSVPVTVTAVNGGATEVSITQPPGFLENARNGPLQLTVQAPYITVQPNAIAVNGQNTLSVSVVNWPNGKALPPVTITSSDPSKLLFAASSVSLGSASVTVSPGSSPYGGYSVYMNALEGPVDVPITISSPGLATTNAVVSIGWMALALSNGYNGSTITTNLQNPVNVSLSTVAISAAGAVTGNVTLRPGLSSMPVTIESSNPSVADVPTSPILNSLTSSAPFTVQPLAAGQTTLSVSPVAGYRIAPTGYGRTLQVTVNGASFTVPNLTLGVDLEAAATLSVQNGGSTIVSAVDVTLVSANPNAVLLSASATTPGSATLTVHFAQGSSPSTPIYMQALEQTGNFQFAISAPGYVSTTTTVTVAATTFSFNQSLNNETLQNSPVTLIMSAHPVSYNGNYQFRPGVTGPTIAVVSSNPAVATISPASAVWPAAGSQLTFTVQLLSAGSSTLTFTVPAPYTAPAPLPVTVTGATLDVSSLTLGSNLQLPISISTYTSQYPPSVTVTSSNPSLVLVSASAAAAGQASTAVTYTAGSPTPSVYVQALAASGSATLTFSATGYQNATATVTLAPAAVELSQPNFGTLTPLSAPLAFQAYLTTYNGGYSSAAPTLRPGASPVTVQVSFNGPTIGTVTPSQITFNPGDSSHSFSFQPTTPGTSLLTLSVPAGFTDPVSARQQLLTVVPAAASFESPLRVGYDLETANYAELASPVASALNVTLTSANPAQLLLGNSANPNGVASLVVTINANSTTSSTFYLIGLAATGTVGLSVSAPGLSTSTSTVTLQPSGFVFGNVSGSTTVHAPIELPVSIYPLDPNTLAPLTNSNTGFVLRPGIAPVSLTVTSSNTAVIASPLTILFDALSSQSSLSTTAIAAGATTLTLQPPAGFSTPSSGAAITITAQ